MSIKFYTKSKRGWLMRGTVEAFTFPGGEPHIRESFDPGDVEYQIADVRGANSHDLITLAMWADYMWQRHEKNVLLLPYLPGARADRGAPGGARVYAEFINNMVVDQVITLDPHSEVMPGLLDELTVFPVSRIIKRELGARGDTYDHPYVGVIAPDKGAHDRAANAARALGVPVYQAGKTRDFDTGKLTGFTCEALPESGKLLVVDDICDGGGTFIGLAEATGLPHNRLDLWVTHGIFSKGIAELTYYFDHIYTTDSWGTAETDENLTVFPVLPYLMGEINA